MTKKKAPVYSGNCKTGTKTIYRLHSTIFDLNCKEVIVSQDTVRRIKKQHDRAAFPVNGDCLAGAGIIHGDIVGVDFTRMPKPPKYKSRDEEVHQDFCLCYARYPGQSNLAVMVKECSGKWGPFQLVSTHPKQKPGQLTLGCSFPADEIFGVVYACWDKDGNLKWEIDTSDYPRTLVEYSTIKGGNVGEPMSMEEAREGLA